MYTIVFTMLINTRKTRVKTKDTVLKPLQEFTNVLLIVKELPDEFTD
jgi:hypothetical protein